MAKSTSLLIAVDQLLLDLINVSEKAAIIARSCRAEKQLFSLLIEEKKNEEKNERFIQDFKTLADVLVQETIRHDLSKKYPDIGSHIYGEENNHFTNILGETISVEIDKFEKGTAATLAVILDGNMTAASILASAVHNQVKMDVDLTMLDKTTQLSISNLGIWIDPIDSTSEYIHGVQEEPDCYGFVTSGLQCVCVLIGAYNLETGKPIMGIINQPFNYWDSVSSRWIGKYFWGMNWNDISVSSIIQTKYEETGRVVTSSSESKELLNILQNKYQVMFVAGAGYKLLTVYLGLADFYILSKGSTYKWDVCGPHSLLLSIGGGIVSYQKALQCPVDYLKEHVNEFQLSYNIDEEKIKDIDHYCNKNGIIAYRDVNSLISLMTYLKSI